MRFLGLLAAGLLFMGAPAQAQDPLPAYQVERTSVHTVTATKNGRTYDLYVKLPPGYDDSKNAGKRYAVLYLTDGGYTFQVASGITRLAHSQKRLEEFILVGLPTAKGEDGMESRRRDLTPWAVAGLDSASGGASVYLDFLVTQAVPLIERTYRVDPARRTLVGQSYGGLFGLWVLFTQPEHFSGYILTSPSIWFNDYALRRLEADYAKQHKDLRAKVYLTAGSFETLKTGSTDKRYNTKHDMLLDQADMARRLAARKYAGLQVKSETTQGTFHETTFPVGLIQALQWLYPQP